MASRSSADSLDDREFCIDWFGVFLIDVLDRNEQSMSLTLEDFQQLSSEIEHLVRAGLPLEQSLVAASGGRGERLVGLSERITAELKTGKSLADIVGQQSLGTPRMLTAAVAAGIRSDNLAVTIEMMGDFASDIVSLRQRLLAAATYPMTIVVTAAFLMILLVRHCLVRTYDSILGLEVQVHPVLLQLLKWNSLYPEWVFIFPAAAMLLLIYWILTGRAASLAFRGPERLLLLLPGVGVLVRDLQQYTMTRMLGLLTDRQIPLDEALILAGGASGSARLQLASERVAEDVRRGASLAKPSKEIADEGADKGLNYRDVMDLFAQGKRPASGLPSLLEVSLSQVDRDESRLVQRLRSVAEFYRGRLERNTAWLKILMPIVTFIVIGGGCVVLYAAMVFWPAAELYRNLGR